MPGDGQADRLGGAGRTRRQTWPWSICTGFRRRRREIRPVPDRVASGAGRKPVLYSLCRAWSGGRQAGWPDSSGLDGRHCRSTRHRSSARPKGDRDFNIYRRHSGAAEAALRAGNDAGRGGDCFCLAQFRDKVDGGAASDMAVCTLVGGPGGRRRSGALRQSTKFRRKTGRRATRLLRCCRLQRFGGGCGCVADYGTGELRRRCFFISPQDQVVSPERHQGWSQVGWGAAREIHEITVGPGDDPFSHVIAGDALSPGMTKSCDGVYRDVGEGVSDQADSDGADRPALGFRLVGAVVAVDEVENQRADIVAPALAGEDAVVAGFRLQMAGLLGFD
jgi:hypothetical protein